MSSAREEPHCSCVDLSAATDTADPSGPSGPSVSSKAEGVYRGPNLTFSLNNNNNTSEEKQHNALQRAFRWRPGKISEEDPSAISTPPNDIKRPRIDSMTESDEKRRWFVEGCSEFLATALQLFIGCSACYFHLDTLASNTFVGTAFGLAVYMSITLFGNISGAHMNPLVTLLHLAFGKLTWTRAVMYMVCQTAGALAGYGTIFLAIPDDVQSTINSQVRNGGTCCTVPLQNMSSLNAIVFEYIITCVLLGVISLNMEPPTKGEIRPNAAFQFGMLITGICFVEGTFTGASMNPARSVGTAIWTGVWERFWVYLVAQALALPTIIVIYAMFRQRQAS